MESRFYDSMKISVTKASFQNKPRWSRSFLSQIWIKLGATFELISQIRSVFFSLFPHGLVLLVRRQSSAVWRSQGVLFHGKNVHQACRHAQERLNWCAVVSVFSFRRGLLC